MSRIRIIGLALVAVFAFSAVVAATASARRTWWYCVPGTPEDKACPNAGEKSIPIPVGTNEEIAAKLKAGTSSVLEITTPLGKAKITCKKIKVAAKSIIYNHEKTGGGKVGWDEGAIEFSECSSALCGKPTEPIRVPKTGLGETVLVEKEKEQPAGKPIYDDFLPEKGSALFAEIKMPFCTIKVETIPAVGRQGEPKEGEGGVTGEIVEAEKYKVIHVFKFICPAEPKKVWDWKLEEIKVNELKEAGCFSGEFEVELVSKKAYDAK
jgi:hypothetical protein